MIFFIYPSILNLVKKNDGILFKGFALSNLLQLLQTCHSEWSWGRQKVMCTHMSYISCASSVFRMISTTRQQSMHKPSIRACTKPRSNNNNGCMLAPGHPYKIRNPYGFIIIIINYALTKSFTFTLLTVQPNTQSA